MRPIAYYNEHDPEAAAWLRALIDAGLIAYGVVDERSIEDVRPSDLEGYTQCHFFAGIGGFSYALRLAGWPDSRPIWTASLPCQPFSDAGLGQGFEDRRHLWPVFRKLVAARRPDVVVGEQVASSLITGTGSSEDLQQLWARKACLGVLSHWLEEDLSNAVQDLPERVRQDIASGAGEHCSYQSLPVGGRGQVSRRDEGPAIRPDSRESAGCAGEGLLRSDRNTVQHEFEARLGDPFSRPEGRRPGLHFGEYSRHPLWDERGMRQLGRGSAASNGRGADRAAASAVQQAAADLDRQIAAAGGGSWIDTLHVDLENLDYSFGCVPFPAASVGAPNIRDRTYWVGHTRGAGLEGLRQHVIGTSPDGPENSCSTRPVAQAGTDVRLANADGAEPQQPTRQGTGPGDEEGIRACRKSDRRDPLHRPEQPGPTNGFWRDADWLLGRDGKFRAVEPNTFPMADGAAARVVRLRGYGNGLNAPQAAIFLQAVLETLSEGH